VTDRKTVLVTGATSGIGLETARILSGQGFRVIVGARDAVRGPAVAGELSAELLHLDMASFASVRRAAERFSGATAKLDVLINNAGIVSRDRRMTEDGHELTWQTNFLSAFLLTRLLTPCLLRAERPRVVNVSSEGHRAGAIPWEDLELSHGYRGLRAYCQSKLALVLFTRELARREPRLAALALHPGAISTNIWRAAPKPLEWLIRAILPSAQSGARPVVRLAISPEVEGLTGRYFKRFREMDPAPAGRNDADAARLWQVASDSVASFLGGQSV
jgi:NAD(P)-dependent dehydrogenase (short-subunit alcohol dehydrogenase family)